MKGWMFVLLLATALVLTLSGCAQQPEETMINEDVGGDEVNQPLERIQALGTQLDKRPSHTETATFALG